MILNSLDEGLMYLGWSDILIILYPYHPHFIPPSPTWKMSLVAPSRNHHTIGGPANHWEMVD